MKISIALALLIALNGAATAAHSAAAVRSQASGSTEPPQATLAHRQKNVVMAPIKSKAELADYIALTPASKSPLNKLSKASRQIFLDSLTFNEEGVTGFRFRQLEEELTPTEIFKLLSLFGLQDMTRSFKRAKVKTPADRRLLDGEGYSTSEYDDVWDDGLEARPKDREGYLCFTGECHLMNEDYVCLKTCKARWG